MVGPVGPFDAAALVMLAGGAIIHRSWGENYGQAEATEVHNCFEAAAGDGRRADPGLTVNGGRHAQPAKQPPSPKLEAPGALPGLDSARLSAAPGETVPLLSPLPPAVELPTNTTAGGTAVAPPGLDWLGPLALPAESFRMVAAQCEASPAIVTVCLLQAFFEVSTAPCRFLCPPRAAAIDPLCDRQSAMYTVVFMWTPAIEAAVATASGVPRSALGPDQLPFGIIFAAFMVRRPCAPPAARPSWRPRAHRRARWR